MQTRRELIAESASAVAGACAIGCLVGPAAANEAQHDPQPTIAGERKIFGRCKVKWIGGHEEWVDFGEPYHTQIGMENEIPTAHLYFRFDPPRACVLLKGVVMERAQDGKINPLLYCEHQPFILCWAGTVRFTAQVT